MSWYRKIGNVFRSERLKQDIDRELEFHLGERAEELRAEGMSPAEAQRAARRRLGNPGVRAEETRDMDVAAWLDGAVRSLRYAARSLAKAPAFTLTVVATLALGIGANSAVFSAIDAVLLKPLPFPEGDRLVRLEQRNPRTANTFIAPVRLADWMRLNSTFDGMAGYYSQTSSELSGEFPEKITLGLATPGFLRVLGIAPALGRDYSPEEERYNGPAALLLSDAYWRRRFHAAPDAIGKQLRINAATFPIIGVLPPSVATIARTIDVWMVQPLDMPAFPNARLATWLRGVGRLKPGVTLEHARANLAAVQAELGRQYPEPDAALTAAIDPLKEVTIGGLRGSLWLLYGSASLLLLIACANIAALLLARGAQRRQEIAVRFSLGASRAAVAGQLLAEAFVLSLAGAAMGLLLAWGAMQGFRILAADLPRVDEIELDWRLAVYTLVSSAGATLLCGLLPALRGARRTASSLAAGSRTQIAGRHGLQGALVGAQVALAVALLAGAGLLARSFQELGRVQPGFDPSHILTFQLSASWAETVDMPALAVRSAKTREFLQNIPGVESVASAMHTPGTPTLPPNEWELAEGRASGEPKIVASLRPVSASYFATLRIPLLAGELCGDNGGELVNRGMVVNRAVAERYFEGKPIGYHFKLANQPPVPIVGVVGDARENGLQQPPVPMIYLCFGMAQPGNWYLVRTRGEPAEMAETLRRRIREFEPDRSMYSVATLEELLDGTFAEDRLRAFLLAFFAATAITLACVGLYGLLTYTVNTRRREVGLRLALGAMRGEIVRRFLWRGLALALGGCAAGAMLGAAFVRLLGGMLYGVSPADATAWAGVIAIVLGVAAAASLVPALRAARLEPMQVLREE